MEHMRPVAAQALKLGPVERAELIELLLTSFDETRRGEIDALWAAEAEDRLDAHDAGNIPAVAAEDVFKRVGG